MGKNKSFASGTLLTGLSLFLLIAGIADGTLGEGFDLYRLKERGVEAAGVVIDGRVEMGEGPLGKFSHYVTYGFEAKTADALLPLTKEELVSQDMYIDLLREPYVSVTYLPNDPNVGTIQDVGDSLMSTAIWAGLSFGGLGLGIFSLIFFGPGGKCVTRFGLSLGGTGVLGFIGSFFKNARGVGPTRSAYAFAAVLGMAIAAVGFGFVGAQREKGKPAPRLTKPHNSKYASAALNLKLSSKKLSLLFPKLASQHGALHKTSSSRSKEREMLARLEEHVRFGDSQPAVVISTDPLLVAAYTKDIDCVAILRYPARFVSQYGLQLKSRLVTINTHMRGDAYQSDLTPGPAADGMWQGFHPVIADFVSDDAKAIAERKASIDDQRWDYVHMLGVAHVKAQPQMWRDGRPFFSRKARSGIKAPSPAGA